MAHKVINEPVFVRDHWAKVVRSVEQLPHYNISLVSLRRILRRIEKVIQDETCDLHCGIVTKPYDSEDWK